MSSKTVGGSNRKVGVHFDGDLRRGLMDAAITLLTDVGYEQLSLRGVARHIGVSHAAPAHHFGDKAGLLTAIATEGFEMFVSRSDAALVDQSNGSAGDLEALGRVYLEFAAQHPAHFDLMFRPALLHPADPDYARASQAAYLALRGHVEALQLRGWHPEADTTALTTATWALIHGLSTLRAEGSLEPHHPGVSTDDVLAIAAVLTTPALSNIDT